MTDNLANEIQAVELDATEALILLYQLEWVPAEGNTAAVYLNFHSYDSDETITFDGDIYHGMPMTMDGVERKSEGPSSRPNLTFPNVETLFRTSNALRTQLSAAGISDFVLEDLLGKRLIYRRTLRKYIKLGNESAPSNSFQFPKNEYVIDRISGKTSITVTVELASPFELGKVKVPNRIVTGKYCPWSYKGWKLDATDVKSACHWDSKMRNISGNRPFIFFTIDDEPLVHRSCLPANPTNIYWDPSTSYSISDIVYHSGTTTFYQSLTNNNQNNTPVEKSSHWRIVRTYETWTSSLPVTINPGDARKATYVYKNGEVYRAVRIQNVNGNSGETNDPETNPAFWVRADVCGKLLSSCKARYQVDLRTGFAQTQPPGGFAAHGISPQVLLAIDNSVHAIPTAIFNNQISLPFGGFPGTKTFR